MIQLLLIALLTSIAVAQALLIHRQSAQLAHAERAVNEETTLRRQIEVEAFAAECRYLIAYRDCIRLAADIDALLAHGYRPPLFYPILLWPAPAGWTVYWKN